MQVLRYTLLVVLTASFFSCEKALPPTDPDPVYEILANNEFFDIQARYALFLSDNTGKTVAFRWLKGEDTTLVQVPNSTPDEFYDCTILKISTLEAPGTGIKDTTLTLTTYTQLPSGRQINLRDLFFQQVSTLKFTLSGFTTLDSIVVSDGLTLSRPQASNGYYGEYLVYNTDQCWLRVLVDGETFWRYQTFSNIGTSPNAGTLNAAQMLSNFSPSLPLNFPFLTTWDFKLDGVVDTARRKFFPLSSPIIPPGGAIPVINTVRIFEPVNNDLFNPNRPYINLFRLQTKGPLGTAGGYEYSSDQFYTSVPTALSEPNFDLEETILTNNRDVAVRYTGNFDVLVFTRFRSVTPKINWEVLLKPQSGTVLYQLPDVPMELGNLYPALRNYDFGQEVSARAENYERLNYDQVLYRRLLNADPLWQAKGGYLGREERY